MSRIGLCITGFQDASDPTQAPPTLSPLNCWLWLVKVPLPTLPDPNYPLIFTTDDAVNLSWRAKELTLTYDLTQTDPVSGDSTNFTGSIVMEMMNTTGDTISDEQNIVGNLGQTIFTGTDANGVFEILPGFTGLDSVSNDLYIELQMNLLGLSLSGFGGSTPTSVAFTSGTIPSMGGSIVYDPVPSDAPTWTGTIGLEITAWWPYDNGLSPPPSTNGPIWDATSGAQLITPVPQGL